MAKPKEPTRNATSRQDLGAIEAINYNDSAGAKKVILIDPPIKEAVAGGLNVGPGKYVKITGTGYTLDLVGKAYDAGGTIYQKGDVVSETTSIYMAQEDRISGAFVASKWRRVATKVIGPITVTAGTTVTTGRWHNSVTVAGFLVDDESEIRHIRIRD